MLQQILETLAQDLEQRGKLDLSECFIDGTFVAAKKGDQRSVRLNGAEKPLAGRIMPLSMPVASMTRCYLLLMALWVARSWQYRCTKFERSLRSWYLPRPTRYIC